MKNEFKVIADLIEKDTRVLDVGCRWYFNEIFKR